MCFSASASFVAGTVLTAVGIASVSQVKKPAHFIFAAIPLMFGIQQCCEGFVWLSLTKSEFASFHDAAKYLFLVFAQVIWPFWVPLSFLLIETHPERKKFLRYLVAAGIAASLILTWRLFFSPAVVQIDGCHIDYNIVSTPLMQMITGVLYVAAIVASPFFSTRKHSKLLAFTNLAGLVVTFFFYEAYLVSVWCFFAAAQSVVVLLIVRRMRAEQDKR